MYLGKINHATKHIMSIMIYHRMAEEIRVLSNLKRRCQKISCISTY